MTFDSLSKWSDNSSTRKFARFDSHHNILDEIFYRNILWQNFELHKQLWGQLIPKYKDDL